MKKEKLVEDDIGMIDDLIELIKNLTSLEAHAQASYKSTGDERFLKAKNDFRKIRTKYLNLITKKNFGQVWCLNKHCCECLMRLDEIQARFLSTGQIEEAKSCTEDYNLIFLWLLNLNDLIPRKIEVKSSA
ncbi:MAG: hypothetical protein ACTSR2_01545 [Candidatus Hodarchaeales archaeon]